MRYVKWLGYNINEIQRILKGRNYFYSSDDYSTLNVYTDKGLKKLPLGYYLIKNHDGSIEVADPYTSKIPYKISSSGVI